MQKFIMYLRNLSALQKLLFAGWLTLMVLLPFHAFISTWGGTAIGPYSLWKVWKEILLLALCIPAALLAFKNPAIWDKVKSSWVLRVAGLYTLLHIIIAAVLGRDTDAVLYGLAINLRIVIFFFVSFVLFSSLQLSRKTLIKIILLPCVIVVAFGLLQFFVLPANFLSHFGYEKGVTIAPNNNIDEQPDEVRIMSTLRGPNPLGAYLILPGTLLICLAPLLYSKIRKNKDFKNVKYAALFLGLLVGLAIALYGTHGRAAWIGFAVACLLAIFSMLSKKLRLFAVIAATFVVFISGVAIYQFRDKPFVQTVILHDNPETGGEVTSNDAHIASAKEGLKDIAEAPLTGCAPGCAGPASFYYDKGTNLAENYYLQIAQEVGLLGLLLFLLFSGFVAKELFLRRSDPLALAMLTSLVGISIANLLLHVWADDTLAYVWWGIAGAVVATNFANSPKKLN